MIGDGLVEMRCAQRNVTVHFSSDEMIYEVIGHMR